MKFVAFINGATREPVAINPATVSMVGPVKRADVVAPACLLTIADGRTPVYVAGTFAEVVAALESATAPPVAAAVASSDEAESAAMVLDLLADAAAQRDLGFVDGGAVDDVIGASGADWDSTEATLRALAAKLRGGG